MLSAIPYVFAAIGTFVWAQRVDKTGNRILHLMLTCLLGAVGLALSTATLGIAVKLTGISLAVLAVFAARAIFWTIPTSFLAGRAAAGGLALINSIGTLGGFVGTVMVGQLKDIYGTFAAGIWAMAIAFLISAGLTAFLWQFSKQ
jgi:ACS family tartrate transporter-like MFS transporter